MITSSATATAPAPAAASAPEGPSHGPSLALHAGGLVVVLPAALVLVVGVPACSTQEGQAGGVLGHNSTSLEQARCTQSSLNAGKLLPGQRGLLCPMVRPGAGPQPEPPPLSSLRLLEGCLCCSFCRLFREAVLSLGTSDFMSICKGTHLCLLPAKGQGLGVTQVQRASASCPAAPSCHAAPTHGGEKAAGPFGQTLSSDIPPGLAGCRKALTKTLRHGGT